jgi:hypothetical protein
MERFIVATQVSNNRRLLGCLQRLAVVDILCLGYRAGLGARSRPGAAYPLFGEKPSDANWLVQIVGVGLVDQMRAANWGRAVPVVLIYIGLIVVVVAQEFALRDDRASLINGGGHCLGAWVASSR